MALAMWPILIVAAAFLLYTNHAAALTSPRAPQLKPADELVDWVLGRGGKADARIGKVSNAGLRGLLATRDIKQGDIVIAVPVNTSMDIGPTEWTSGFHFPHWTSPELAVRLLRIKVEDPATWELYQPYLANLPAEDDVYTLYNFRRDHISLLQDPEMEGLITKALDWVQSVFSGSVKEAKATVADLRQLKPQEASLITLRELQHYASIIEAYSFGAINADSKPWRYLVPLMDMANHNEAPNMHVEMDEGLQAFVATALRDIRDGEELTHMYRKSSNRNDVALLHHFFLNELRPPRLCAHDLPSAAQYPHLREAFTDADYAPGGRLCTKEEAIRLSNKLAGFPTSESQDRAALASNRNPIRDWRERLFVEFRTLRKQALRLTVESITAALTQAHRAPAAAVSVEDNDDSVEAASTEASAAAAQATEGAAAGQSRGQRGGRWKPQVVVPLADADVGLQEPKFLKINTPSRSEL